MGIQLLNSNQNLQVKWLLLKNKLSKVSLIRSGKPTMLIRVVSSTRKRPRNSSRTPSATSDPVTSSPTRLSMRSSLPSTRMAPVPSRSQRWSFSSSNSLVETEQPENQDSYNDDQHLLS